VIAFTIPGKPFAWQRAVTFVDKKTGRIVKKTPGDMKAQQLMIGQLCRLHMRGRSMLTGPIKLEVLCVYAIPASWTKAKQAAARAGLVWKTSVPDADNLAKMIGDALNGVAWGDDAQVVHQTSAKRYGEPERTMDHSAGRSHV
jgi:Holliday junction resolvase RusA-like endonuclease